MKSQNGKRIWSMILIVCLMLSLLPAFVSSVEVEAEAVSGVNSLTCSSFISNATRQNYIDVMMRYYINNSSTLQSQLNNGNSVVFMFEGGSDYYDSYAYADGSGQTRLQAVCIVVQMDSSGNAYIAFYSEKCCSLPDDANYVTPGYEGEGSTTILDGIYKMTTCNHNGNYAAHTTTCSTGWYTPYDGSTGYSAGCYGINIHTRGVNYSLSYGGNSMGCQLIGYGANSSNDYNTFMKTVTGITWNAYDGTQRTFSSYGGNTGYYVVDRQLGIMSPDGTEYGSGSLIELYTTGDIAGITAYSTSARANADFDYVSKCTYYPAHCKIQVAAGGAEVNSQPCSVDTDDSSVTLETVAEGTAYTATGLYQNEYGNYWYRVTTSSGETGYIYGGEAEYVEQITSDIGITDYDTPNGHVSGEIFYVTGKIASKYNRIDTAAVWIHSGFGTSGSTVTGYSDTVGGFSYTLNDSTIDYNTAFNSVPTGNHTYAISCTYTNYYAEGATTLKSNTGTIPLVEEYFVVVSSSVSQSSCSHSYTTTVVEEGSCTQPGKSVQACSTCGLVNEVTTGADGHSYGGWTTVSATCTADGYQKRTCSACGNVETVTISATGHSYSMTKTEATCSAYAKYTMTCGSCGDSYSMTADEMASSWLEEIPAGMDASLFNSKQQYRYSDYQTQTSYETSLAGYTLKSSAWEQSGSGSIKYVPSWPSGFSTSSSLYTQYNKKSSKVTASETSTAKTVVNSDAQVGYLYYHWCYTDSYYSSESSSGSYTTFHAFYSTTTPPTDSGYYDSSDCSHRMTENTVCSNSEWFFHTDVYAQDYTTYKKLFTYERWTDYTDWSDTAVTASDTRKVETRTVYQLKDASLGDHVWADGACSACGTACEHSFTDGYCTICGMAEPIKDYYLFGYINGANYACEEDYENMGEYKFVDGKLVVTFSQVSYVAVKTNDNYKWYMTDGYVGDDVTSVTLYDTTTLTSSDKLRVPRGREITFTLVVNEDGTLTLSYVAAGCEHTWVDGTCSNCDEVCEHISWAFGACEDCGKVCDHAWVDGTCSVCSSVCSHTYSNNTCTTCGYQKPQKDYYLFGYINGADYACEADYANLGEYKFVNNQVTATFEVDSYVAVKSGDNADWYMTNGWLGTEATAATLYNTNTGANEKLYVPGGVKVTFTLIDNGNDTYLLTYVMEEIALVQPTLTLKYPSLSFESEVLYNVYYIAENTDDVVEMGLATFDTELTDGTVDNATDVIPGFESDGSIWKVGTNGIPAKCLGDTVYFKVYAKLSDGSYVYSAMKYYNAISYANTILNRSTSTSYMKSLVVAMLNYGAEAQTYFAYNTDSLMNAGLTADQQALVNAYDETMVDALTGVYASKLGGFVYDGSSFTRRAPSVSFDSAFALNYYFTAANTPDDGMTLYYWDLETYNSVYVLTTANATGTVEMVPTDTANQYWGQVSGIAAKALDSTVFVAGVYEYGGTTYTTGVLNYSIGRYCEGIAANTSSAQCALAQATAVYGYYAKEYFANL